MNVINIEKNVNITYSQIFLKQQVQQHYEKLQDKTYFIRVLFLQ